MSGITYPLLAALCLMGGFLVWYSECWKVRGPALLRYYVHCRNFCIGVCIGLGLWLCVVGFLWDIGAFRAGS